MEAEKMILNVLTIFLLGIAGCGGGTVVPDVNPLPPIFEEKTPLNGASLTLNGVSQEFSCVALPPEELTYSVVAGVSRTIVTLVLELTGQEDGIALTLGLPLSVEENGVPVFVWEEGQMLGFGPTVGGTFFSTDEVLSIDVHDESGLHFSSWHGGAEGFVEAVQLGRTEGEPIELNFKNIVVFNNDKTDSLVLDGSLHDVIENRDSE